MFRYKLINTLNNEVKAIKELEQDIENPWEDKFSKFENFQGIANNYRIQKDNIDDELLEAEQKKQNIKDARNALKNVKSILQAAKALNNSPEKQVIKELAKAVLQLSKAQGYADALDSED